MLVKEYPRAANVGAGEFADLLRLFVCRLRDFALRAHLHYFGFGHADYHVCVQRRALRDSRYPLRCRRSVCVNQNGIVRVAECVNLAR